MAQLLNERSTRSNGKYAIKSREYSRLVCLLRNALTYYKYFGEEGDEDFEFFSSIVRKSDDQKFDFILNEQFDEVDKNNEEDSVSSDGDELKYTDVD